MPYQHMTVRSGDGLVVHLAEARAETTLCGRPATAPEIRMPFELSGCRRCSRIALDSGTKLVVEFDGERVDLAQFLAHPR